jgi:hypothetical protein
MERGVNLPINMLKFVNFWEMAVPQAVYPLPSDLLA